MRTIKKRAEPVELRQWRAGNQTGENDGGINFGYDVLRQSPEVVSHLMDSLLAEQGALCAYTGRRVGRDSAHIEHLVAQSYCVRGQDVAYDNMVACWPHPNSPREQYGAHPKENWPAPREAAQFVSPLSHDCEARFEFNQRGEIKPSNPTDKATATTIVRLKLDHKLLTALRRCEIESVLGTRRSLSLKAARQRLKGIKESEKELLGGANVQLNPFCFAVKQALIRYIKTGERIQKYSKPN